MKRLLPTQNQLYFRFSFVLIPSLLWLLIPSTTIQLREAAAKVVERAVSAPLPSIHNRPMQQNEPACNENAANTCVDFGNPNDEAFHNLAGWDNIQTEFPLAPPSGDNTVRYPSLTATTSFELYLPTLGASYLMTIETHDGVCDDSFSVDVNALTNVYSYNADDTYGSATHEILLESTQISTTVVSVTVQNLATDNCGKAGLFRAWVEQIEGDVYEPDENTGNATFISSGEEQQHTISPIGESDAVRIVLASESAIRIETSGADTYDTVIYLYDEQLNLIEENDDGGYFRFSLIDRECGVDALPPGTYYVGITDYSDNNELSYTLNYTVIEECSSPSTAWNLIENFNGRSLGELNGQGSWVSNGSQVTTIPGNTGQVALIDEQEYLKRNISPQSDRITLHSCMYQTSQIDMFFGLSDRSNPTEFNHFEVQVGTNWHSNAALVVRDGADTGFAQRRFLMDQWLHVWYVIDSTTNTFRIYASNSEDSAQIINIAGRTVFNFRNGRNNPLQTLFANTGVAASGSFYLDDIYISEGINLSIPDSCTDDTATTNLPDLEIIDVNISIPGYTCEDWPHPPRNWSVTIRNGGTSSAAEFDVSVGNQTQTVQSLASGATVTLQFSELDYSTNSAFVDTQNSVLESNEANNSWQTPPITMTPIAPCTNTPVAPTVTDTPTSTPTNTTIPPTNTPIPPTVTDTPTSTPTNTTIPPTNTPIPPTITNTPTSTPTNTTIPPTNTPIPPTVTDTPTSTPTNTTIPPTNTPIPPTKVPISPPTFTSTPVNTPIDTPTPKPTVSNGTNAYEPNNNPEDANIINSRQQQLHTISPAADQDYVQFVLNAESAVQIVTSGGSELDTQLYLFDENLNQIDFNGGIGNQGNSLIQRDCEVNSLPAGTYFIRVESNENASEFDYALDFLVLEECARDPSAQDNSNRLAYLPMVVKIDPASPTPTPTFTPSPVPPSWQQVGMENIEIDVISSYPGYILAGGRNAEAGTGALYIGTSCFSSSPTNIPIDAGIRDIAIADDLRSLVATENKAAFYTTDLTRVDGWTSARLPDETGSFTAAIAPNGSQYVSTDKGVYHSSDNGDSWTLLNGTPELINAFELDAATGTIWIGSYGEGEAKGDGIFKLDIASNQFTPMNNGLIESESRRIWDFAIADNGRVYAATDHGIYKLNSENLWNRIVTSEEDLFTLAIWDNKLFAAVEKEGIWFAPFDNIGSWQFDTRGIPATSTVRDLHVDTSALCKGLLAATDDGIWALK